VRGLNEDVTLTVSGQTRRKFQPANIDDFPRFDVGLAAAETAVDSKGHIQTPRRHLIKNGWLRHDRVQTYLSVDVSDIIATNKPFSRRVSAISRMQAFPLAGACLTFAAACAPTAERIHLRR